jgi:hypothetical protein
VNFDSFSFRSIRAAHVAWNALGWVAAVGAAGGLRVMMYP